VTRLGAALVSAGALALLGISRLLPATGFGLGVRLAAATLVLLVPGMLVARALRTPGAAASLSWTLACVAGALVVVFATGSALTLALVLLALCGAVALPFVRPGGQTSWLVVAGGVALGILLWHVAGTIVAGDAPFHLARMRKLDDFGSLSLRAVDEFRDGGLHPGYAFPLWHAFLALVARLAGVDPSAVILHESSVLAALAVLVSWEAGATLFRSRSMGIAVAAGQVGLFALAPGHGGSFRTLALPSSAAQLLLFPAVLALGFRAVRDPSPAAYASVAAAGLVLTLVHPTYAGYLLIVLGGWLVARLLLARRDGVRIGGVLAGVAVPAIAVGLWLRPLADETVTRTKQATPIAQYQGQVQVLSQHRYRVAPQVLDRRGTLAIAALALIPLAGLAPRRRWSAFVLGASLSLLSLLLIPELFVRLSDLVSLSQARRAAGFLPLSFALAGGAAVLTRLLGPFVLVAAVAAGIALQAEYPGDFGYRLGSGGPAAVTWFALIGGALALVLGALFSRRLRFERPGVLAALAVCVLTLPVAVDGFRKWSAPAPPSAQQLPPGLVSALRRFVPERSVVFSDPETSYLVAAAAPVYVASAPPAHVADTKANRPYDRVRDAARYLRSGSLAIPRGYGARFVLLDRRRTRIHPHLPVVWSDGRYLLLRL
jgi:hypothetical protein